MRTWGICAAFCAALVQAPAAHASDQLLLFDPDANHQMIVKIASLFNRYLENAHEDISFQPVDSFKKWQALLQQPQSRFSIVPLHFAQKLTNVHLKPLLVPEAESSVYYQKHLGDLGAGKAGDLQGKSIATTVAADESAQVLELLAKGHVNVQGAFVMSVAKDLDALLALVFGQADAALVTPLSLKVLQRINPTAAAKFRVVFTTEKILRAPLCVVDSRANQEADKHLTQLMQDLDKSPEGKQLLKELAVDRWVPFQADMVQ